ncbi:hypothetical protein NEFER03_1007 [Nematocida sp. LUAm3]|nr:hypothetical protein NEFER03_1007 [Nematocida sp. LUAm3]KAI5175389.1 hypothetical protein NEFER02_1318 [Nematocida sp. LUAm2]KAI5177654.1 hypothetical protein NEFER01_0878 [Nematocida sp. LUAm1]
MNRTVKTEWCMRMLDLLSQLKDGALKKEALEEILVEMNRMLLVFEKYGEIKKPVEQKEIEKEVFQVGRSRVSMEDGRIEIVSSVPGLTEYFKTLTDVSLLDAIEYLKNIEMENICIKCLRRSHAVDLSLPLVWDRRREEKVFYHLLCCADIS